MSNDIRSAVVRLEAQVSKYIADMKAAGKATDEAFSRSSVAVARANKNLNDHAAVMEDVRSETDQAATTGGANDHRATVRSPRSTLAGSKVPVGSDQGHPAGVVTTGSPQLELVLLHA